MPTPRLSPCPWGGKAVMQSWFERMFRVVCQCEGCEVKKGCPFDVLETKWVNTREEAATAWNRRADRKGGE